MANAPLRLLLVEDNPADARLLTEYLCGPHPEEFHCTHVAMLAEALRYLRADHFDLVLLDLNLPKKDGREVLAEIKADPNLRRIPVVVLTTSRAEEDIFRAYDLHANCYITKPVDFKQFLDVVQSIEDFWLTVVKLPANGGH